MAEKKIILCDVDGTLVDHENQLPASAVDVIHKAQARRPYSATWASRTSPRPLP